MEKPLFTEWLKCKRSFYLKLKAASKIGAAFSLVPGEFNCLLILAIAKNDKLEISHQ